jgi:hypothetical protein
MWGNDIDMFRSVYEWIADFVKHSGDGWTAFSPEPAIPNESYWVQWLIENRYRDGEAECVLFDSTRVDILTPELAIEVDWARKWAEAIGQSLYYAAVTGKKPGVVLLRRKKTDERYVSRCLAVCAERDIMLHSMKVY